MCFRPINMISFLGPAPAMLGCRRATQVQYGLLRLAIVELNLITCPRCANFL